VPEQAFPDRPVSLANGGSLLNDSTEHGNKKTMAIVEFRTKTYLARIQRPTGGCFPDAENQESTFSFIP
jgi:hypothetical protein